jgi:hypothetical protein
MLTSLFTWVHGPTGWHGWLALNSSMELAPTVVSGRWFHSRTVLWKKEFVINDYTSRTQGCVTSMLTSLEWQTLEQRRRISRLVVMYKIQHQLVDIDQDLYLRPGDSRTRGQHRFATQVMLICLSRILVFCWCNHL